MEPSSKLAMGILLACLFVASPWGLAQDLTKTRSIPREQQKRAELMRSRGPEGSLTVIPVMLLGKPFDRVSEVVGALLEQSGLKNIELGATPFSPGSDTTMERLAAAVCDFVKKNPVTTEYALYAEYNGDRQTGPNELKILWDLAREFREYCRKNPSGADYALYADYGFNPEQWEQGFVHFVVCDRSGEWVIVDMQNSHHPDYQSVKPTSREDCNRLLVQRLKGYLQ
jgi:hypothetical protein